MHELSIAQNIVDAVIDNLCDYPESTVNSIHVQMGVYSGVDPDALNFSFPFVSEGTRIEGVTLYIEPVPLTITCNECRKESINTSILRCFHCGSTDISIVTGRDLIISSIDISDDG